MTYFGYEKEVGEDLKELKIAETVHFFSNFHEVINLFKFELVMVNMGSHLAFFNSQDGKLIYYSNFSSVFWSYIELNDILVLFFDFEYYIFYKTAFLPLKNGSIPGDIISTKISEDEDEISVTVNGGEGEEKIIIKL
jgi:hypothetical protein